MTQYFEMMGQWAIYHDGWLMSTKANRAPWQAFLPTNEDPLNNQVFQLYDLNDELEPVRRHRRHSTRRR